MDVEKLDGGLSALTDVLGQHVGWMVFLDANDVSNAAMYPLNEELVAMSAAMRWGACVMRVYTAPKVPEGWKLVPVEPTEEMLNACWDTPYSSYIRKYKAMLAAAPEYKP